jgi:hypothetical protein
MFTPPVQPPLFVGPPMEIPITSNFTSEVGILTFPLVSWSLSVLGLTGFCIYEKNKTRTAMHLFQARCCLLASERQIGQAVLMLVSLPWDAKHNVMSKLPPPLSMVGPSIPLSVCSTIFNVWMSSTRTSVSVFRKVKKTN